MDYIKSISTIKSILNDNYKDKVCIFIDGQWGIGKTYTINKFIDSNSNLSLNYVSVFGKQDLREIEKDIIIQLLFGNKINKDKLIKNNGAKIIGNVLSDVVKQFTGIDSNFIRDISIENIPSEDKAIICIDDLERKSEKLDINDILGLIERTSSNFNVIIIANASQFTKEQITSFNKFKEKVIDYELVVDELSDETLGEILVEKFESLEKEVEYKIIETFKKNTESLNNLRIYKKYINLIYKVNFEINTILNYKGFNADEKIIQLCNRVVVENYIDFDKDTKTKKNNLGYRIQELKGVIEKIFKYEEYDKIILKEYCETFSQIKKDINSFYNLYKLSREEASEIANRILENLKSENKEYFIKQKYIIELYDVLCEIGIISSFKKGLVNIAEKLYEFDIEEKPEQFNIEDYNTCDPVNGEQENYNVIPLIKHINNYNVQMYNELKEKRLLEVIDDNDIRGIEMLFKYFNNISYNDFTKIYSITTKVLSRGYDDTAWHLLCQIIDKTDSTIVEEFLKKEKSDKKDGIGETIIYNARLKRLIDILEEKKYFEWQIECQREYYEQMQDETEE